MGGSTRTSQKEIEPLAEKLPKKNESQNDYFFTEEDEKPTVSKVKRAASQYCAIGATCVLIISYGISIGYTAMLVAAFSQKESDLIVSKDELTWIGSLSMFMIPVGAVLSGSLSQLAGRRGAMRAMTLPMAFTWLLIYMGGQGSGQLWLILAALGLQGIIMGLIESPTQIYVTEISEPGLRGSVSAVISAAISLGVLVQTILGSCMHWRQLALTNGVLPVVAFFVMGLVPESPHWLLRKGHVQEARSSLCWLRGWINPNESDPAVHTEFSSILSTFNHANNTTASNITTSRRKSCLRAISLRYLRREVYLPFAMVCFAFVVSCFNGPTSLFPYAVPVFEQLHSPLDGYFAAVLFSGLQLIAVMLVVPVVPLVGKRWLTFVSLAVCALANLVVAAHAFLDDEGLIQGESSTWLPTSAILLLVFSFGVGIRTTPWILAGEIFPAEVRIELAGIAGCVCTFAAALANKCFLYQLEVLGLSGSFLFFAVVNIVGLLVLWSAMPNTDGLSLAELETLYSKDDDAKAALALRRDDAEFQVVEKVKA